MALFGVLKTINFANLEHYEYIHTISKSLVAQAVLRVLSEIVDRI